MSYQGGAANPVAIVIRDQNYNVKYNSGLTPIWDGTEIGNPSAMVAFLPLSGDVLDHSPNGNNGTIKYKSSILNCYYKCEGKITDESGNGRDLSLNNGFIQYDTGANASQSFVGASGKGLLFDGATSYTAPNAVRVIGTGDRTISFKLKTPTSWVNGSHGYVFSWGSNANNSSCMGVIVATSTTTAKFNFEGWNNNTNGVTTLAVDTWYHFIITVGSVGTVRKIYISGVQDSTTTGTALNTSGTFVCRIGADLGTTNFLQAGTILDEFKIYQQELTGLQPFELWNSIPEYQTGMWAGSQSYFLDGVTYIELDNENSFDFDWNTPFSVAFWYDGESPIGANYCFVTKNITGGGGGVGWSILQNDYTLFFDMANTTTNEIRVKGSTSINTGAPKCCIITYDGSGVAAGVKMYVGNVLETMSTQIDNLQSNSVLNNVPVTIGGSAGQQGLQTGLIQGVRIYNRVMTSSERSDYFAKGFTDTYSTVGQNLNIESVIGHLGINDDYGTMALMIPDPDGDYMDTSNNRGASIFPQQGFVQVTFGDNDINAGTAHDDFVGYIYRVHIKRPETGALYHYVFAIGIGVRTSERMSSMKRFQRKQYDSITMDSTDTSTQASELFKDIFRKTDHYVDTGLPQEIAIAGAGYDSVDIVDVKFPDFQESFQSWAHLIARLASASGAIYGIGNNSKFYPDYAEPYFRLSGSKDSGFLITNDTTGLLSINWNQKKLCYIKGALEYWDSTEKTGYSILHAFGVEHYVIGENKSAEDASYDLSTNSVAIPFIPTAATIGKIAIKMKKYLGANHLDDELGDLLVSIVGTDGLGLVTSSSWALSSPTATGTMYMTKITGLPVGKVYNTAQLNLGVVSGNVKVRVYKDDNPTTAGDPYSLLSESNSLTAITGYHSYALNSSFAVPPSGNVWVAFDLDNGTPTTTFAYATGFSGCMKYVAHTYASASPSPLSAALTSSTQQLDVGVGGNPSVLSVGMVTSDMSSHIQTSDVRKRIVIPAGKLAALSSSVTSWVEAAFDKIPVVPNQLLYVILTKYGNSNATIYPSYFHGIGTQLTSSDEVGWSSHTGVFALRTYPSRSVNITLFNTEAFRKYKTREMTVPIRDKLQIESARQLLVGASYLLGKPRRFYNQIEVTAPTLIPPVGQYVRLIDTMTNLDIIADITGIDFTLDADKESNLGLKKLTLSLEEYR